MAVVGPRPALWNQYDLIAKRDQYGANDVRPGLTGWAQIHGRDELEISQKAELDGYYVKHMGFLMDLQCIFFTLNMVLRGKSMVEGGIDAVRTERKIMMITNHSYMLYQFRKELITELMRENEVVLSMPFVGREDEFRRMGVRCIETRVDRRGMNPKTDFYLIKTYFRILREERPDFVITYSIKPNIYAGLVCTRLGIPFCANVQGLGTSFQEPKLIWIVTFLYKAAFRKVKMVFFENEDNAKEFRSRRMLPKDKITVLRGAGVNLEHYAFQKYPEHHPVHFLYVGRIMKEKGMDELFDAVRRLRAEGKEFLLDLVGFFEGEYREQVQLLQEEGIAVFHKFQEDPRPYYAAADCVVMPSYHEGMSNVLLEAAAVGRAVITTDIPGCREAVEHGKTGLLCEVKSTSSLYHAMKCFLDLPAERRAAMGEAGRQKMEKEFRKEWVVADTLRAFERIR